MTRNSPESYEGPLGDGERICINSTVPYLAVTFQQTTLLKIRYFSRNANSKLIVSSGHFFIPSEITAIGFGETIGHVEIQALIPGTVGLSIFAYPTDCSHHRYVTTVSDDTFRVSDRLGIGEMAESVSPYGCLWSPHQQTAITSEANANSRDSVLVCTADNCIAPSGFDTDGSKTFEFYGSQYVKVAANKPDFIEGYRMTLSVKSADNFLESSGVFDTESDPGFIYLTARDATEPHPKVDEENDNADAVKEVHGPATPLPATLFVAPKHTRRFRPLRTLFSALEILALISVIVGCVVFVGNVIFKQGVNRGREDADSLLGRDHGQGDGQQPAPAPGPVQRLANYFPHGFWGGQPQYGVGFYPSPQGLPYGYSYQPQPFPGAVFPQATPQPGDQSPSGQPQ